MARVGAELYYLFDEATFGRCARGREASRPGRYLTGQAVRIRWHLHGELQQRPGASVSTDSRFGAATHCDQAAGLVDGTGKGRWSYLSPWVITGRLAGLAPTVQGELLATRKPTTRCASFSTRSDTGSWSRHVASRATRGPDGLLPPIGRTVGDRDDQREGHPWQARGMRADSAATIAPMCEAEFATAFASRTPSSGTAGATGARATGLFEPIYPMARLSADEAARG